MKKDYLQILPTQEKISKKYGSKTHLQLLTNSQKREPVVTIYSLSQILESSLIKQYNLLFLLQTWRQFSLLFVLLNDITNLFYQIKDIMAWNRNTHIKKKTKSIKRALHFHKSCPSFLHVSCLKILIWWVLCTFVTQPSVLDNPFYKMPA